MTPSSTHYSPSQFNQREFDKIESILKAIADTKIRHSKAQRLKRQEADLFKVSE